MDHFEDTVAHGVVLEDEKEDVFVDSAVSDDAVSDRGCDTPQI